ncbi:type II toxin-antitoxin system antitoxin DNA ADP-ribosyl glycohydrolase DarG [Methylotenera sp.]|uniref:type II toxin-antitoxin system antitoxin DNA ADP-ribosyl glycohydrolase DarG n=1 Tax=Methylotenera sp. TaxID=2051956 RepID=UPI002EDA88AA
MSITFKSGDLFLDKAEALVNTVNCVGVMGKGVALEFKRRWPENYKAYKKACNAKVLRPGSMLIFELTNLFGKSEPKFIVNFPTKDHWRAKSKLEYISEGLDALVGDIKRYKIKSIALPPLGCGNGGLDWDVVRPIILEKLSVLDDVSVSIYAPLNESDDPEYVDTNLKMTQGRAIFLKSIAELETSFGGVLDRLSLQKIAYFLQVMGVPLNLDFTKNLYGPYSEALKKAIVALEVDYKLIAGFQTDREAHVTPAGFAVAEDYLKNDEKSEAVIDNLTKLVDGFETPYGLELLSTVHKLATTSEVGNNDIKYIASEMVALEKNKRNVFPEEEIRLAFHRLKEDNLL